MIIIKHLQMYLILTLNDSEGIDMPLNESNFASMYTVDFVLNLHFLMDLYRFFLKVNDKCWIVTGFL